MQIVAYAGAGWLASTSPHHRSEMGIQSVSWLLTLHVCFILCLAIEIYELQLSLFAQLPKSSFQIRSSIFTSLSRLYHFHSHF
ncbi:uncharacterized protein BDZ99DRAFT_104194 [Mytilinidion resinicola]|uniref:Uncharacterized protein n=1 Tax=Mytilinidion resinicola TaxID=574789 RepID=A0A6A6YDP3_9PEZI|nr:uncharacterized protein BDZ99DRAFT_104194 [Mytilinidion resinicola]KAF2806114.1 hypothetical protein BDZ99DRAFT_104194 [Mytilinidion resinicola]